MLFLLLVLLLIFRWLFLCVRTSLFLWIAFASSSRTSEYLVRLCKTLRSTLKVCTRNSWWFFFRSFQANFQFDLFLRSFRFIVILLQTCFAPLRFWNFFFTWNLFSIFAYLPVSSVIKNDVSLKLNAHFPECRHCCTQILNDDQKSVSNHLLYFLLYITTYLAHFHFYCCRWSFWSQQALLLFIQFILCTRSIIFATK